ncbi:MAG: hypothetical protein A3J79_01910 [Elusimicrobia bacterium RIFOXYB2_FULL_62_6]|nr:MAG: hypothetical protein A3J79_01910 [Elusimicrobia bacterium RIFOXYB2_FULL_62_6]
MGEIVLSKENILARKIIGFYADKNIDCSVVAEKPGFLVILRSMDRTHKFRCRARLPVKKSTWDALYNLLNLEFEKFQEQPVPAAR